MSIITPLLSVLGLIAATSFTNLTADEFEKLIAQPGVVILDVRTADEFAESHIEGAVNVDVNGAGFKEEISALNLRSRTKLAVYCRSGRRSANACNILTEMGFRNVSNLSTGILGWTEAGKPTTE